MNDAALRFRPGAANQAGDFAPLIYDSVHELMAFMFGARTTGEAVLTRLLALPRGQFSHTFVTALLVDGEIAGVELGYDCRQLAAQALPGALNMLRAAPLACWPHLLGPVNRALSGYVPPPATDAYYINNIAVSDSRRGAGLGVALLDHVVASARLADYRCVELDVTHSNTGAIRFYTRYGFAAVGESGSQSLAQRHGLPQLLRLRYPLRPRHGYARDNRGDCTSSIVINDVSGLNPVAVEEVYAPGSVQQLQQMVRTTERPLSIGGGRFSMGGQTALPGTLHIDLRGLDQVLALDAVARRVSVQAGARWCDIQAVIADQGLAISIMQTYSNFTVGGSLSVNCHGRYVGLGPLVLSVCSIVLLLHDGELIEAAPDNNAELFYGAIGGYGALGIIVEAELELAPNTRIERVSRRLALADYTDFFEQRVRHEPRAVFHNADMIPPRLHRVRAVTWLNTDKAVNTRERRVRRLHLAEKYMLWAITETPGGHLRREFVYEPLLYLRPRVAWRNNEADYDVAELEPLSRDRKTYVLQEYFVPVAQLQAFSASMAEILTRHRVSVVNVSIRHAHADPGTLLAWARQEVFALVLYYKQGTEPHDRERVGVWTRELIDAALACQGSYYLPYQPHARYDQFHAAYPRAGELFELKRARDPDYRFRNILWEKYYRTDADPALLPGRDTAAGEFLSVYNDVRSRDDFYRFLQVVYHLYPEDRFHDLIVRACERLDDDDAIYDYLARALPRIKPFLSELSYALPALGRQKREMTQQTVRILRDAPAPDGYLEIGSTGRYVKHLRRALRIRGEIYLSNESAPDYSPPEIMERGGLRPAGRFFPLDDYAPLPQDRIAAASLDLVTCYIGLHHCPREKLAAYLASIHRVLRPGGHFVLRDHDAGSDAMRTFCSLVHTVFNAGLGVAREVDRQELRCFESVDFWVEAVTREGFIDSGQRLLQANDPSRNTLLCFVRDTPAAAAT